MDRRSLAGLNLAWVGLVGDLGFIRLAYRRWGPLAGLPESAVTRPVVACRGLPCPVVDLSPAPPQASPRARAPSTYLRSLGGLLVVLPWASGGYRCTTQQVRLSVISFHVLKQTLGPLRSQAVITMGKLCPFTTVLAVCCCV